MTAQEQRQKQYNQIRYIFEQQLKKRGYSVDKYLPLVLAQSAYEGGWWSKESGRNNYFGIKGKGSKRTTKELVNGQYKTIEDSFKDYSNLEEGIVDYFSILERMGAFNTDGTPQQWAKVLKDNGYFTEDVNKYTITLQGIINGKTMANLASNYKPHQINKNNTNMTIMNQYLTQPNDATRVQLQLHPAPIKKNKLGGLIPKFQNSGHIEKRWYGNVWVKDKPTSYHTEKRWYGTISVPDEVPSKALPKVDRSVTQAEIDEVKKLNAGIQASKNKPTDTKPAGTQGNGTKGGTKGSGTRGNARTTAKPAATTTITTPTATPASTPTENTGIYTIQHGDTLGAIAKRYGTTVAKLAKLNNIKNVNRIYAGHTLNLPGINVPDNLLIDNNEAREIESTIPQTQQLVKSVDTKTTPYIFYYQQQIAKNPNLTREALWQATQDVRNGNRDASYYGEYSDLVSKLARDNQNSAKNYIYNLWNTNNDVATQAGRKNYTESQGLTFGEPTTNNAAFQSINTNQPPMYYTGPGSWLTDNSWKKKIDDIYTRYKQNTQSARQGTKLIRRK